MNLDQIIDSIYLLPEASKHVLKECIVEVHYPFPLVQQKTSAHRDYWLQIDISLLPLALAYAHHAHHLTTG